MKIPSNMCTNWKCHNKALPWVHLPGHIKAAFLWLTNVDSDPRDGSQQVTNGSNRHYGSVWFVKFSLGKAGVDLK